MIRRPVRVAGAPNIHAIHDAITSTMATDKASGIRLPKEFYDEKLCKIVDRLAYEEEFGGYGKSRELRMVGIGAMLGDVVERMVLQTERSTDGPSKFTSTGGSSTGTSGIEDCSTKLWLHGSHDSTLGAIMASLGADELIEGERRWPSYGSVLAIELFCDTESKEKDSKYGLWWSSLFAHSDSLRPIRRTPTSHLSLDQKSRLQNYFVRLRYNNRSLVIPGCKTVGKHWKGDETFCTLEVFKEIVDQFTPHDWRFACVQNLDNTDLKQEVEPAGLCT